MVYFLEMMYFPYLLGMAMNLMLLLAKYPFFLSSDSILKMTFFESAWSSLLMFSSSYSRSIMLSREGFDIFALIFSIWAAI